MLVAPANEFIVIPKSQLTQKGRQKIEGQIIVVRGRGAHLGLRRHCNIVKSGLVTNDVNPFHVIGSSPFYQLKERSF